MNKTMWKRELIIGEQARTLIKTMLISKEDLPGLIEAEEIQFCKTLRYSTKIDELEKRKESE